MIYARDKADTNYWMSFDRPLNITPLDFHIYDFKIDDTIRYTHSIQSCSNMHLRRN